MSLPACALVLTAYVAPFYAPALASAILGRRVGPPPDRDAPATIAFRAVCTVGGCCAATAALYAAVSERVREGRRERDGGEE